jgi:hypothetical protein
MGKEVFQMTFLATPRLNRSMLQET